MSDRSSRYLLQPDVMLPLQYFARHRRQAVAERNLVFAVLQDAINCYQSYAFALDRHGQRLFRETEEWLASAERVPFSFEHICEVLDLDPSYLRTGLRRWREAEQERRSHAVQRLNGTNN